MDNIDEQSTLLTQARYQRIAPLYDIMEILPERRYRAWRQKLWALVEGPDVLEVGVGTGKNMPFYPPHIRVTGIDLTPGMLKRARRRALELGLQVDLQQGDVQALNFPDKSFDEVVATFVFCSVPDPVVGLKEVSRVLKPGSRLLLLEHVRSRKPVIGRLLDIFNPLVVRAFGPNIDRRTVENVQKAGLQIEHVEDLDRWDIFKLIIARRPG